MEEPLFRPQPNRPMHVAVFGSGTGMILRAVLAAQKNDPNCPFAIKLLYTDRLCHFQEIAAQENIPLIHSPWDPLLSREENDHRGVAHLLDFVEKCPIDLLLLAGYMRLLSKVWLHAFPYRILNIHPADLTALDKGGNRKWIGDQAVLKALQHGERKTRTSAILIDETVDGGPLLVSGPWVTYDEGEPVDALKAKKHQEKQKHQSDFPTCIRALQLIAEGKIQFNTLSQKVAICVES